MKVELTAGGTLIISAEGNVEAFALRRWEGMRKSRNSGARLEIHTLDEYFSYINLDDVTAGIKANFVEFQEWKKEKAAKGEKLAVEVDQ